MADLYTRRVVTATIDSASAGIVTTVPAGQSWVLRDVVVSPAVGTGDFILYLQTPGVLPHLFRRQLEVNTSEHLELRQTVNAGEQLGVSVAAGLTVTLAVTAYVFED